MRNVGTSYIYIYIYIYLLQQNTLLHTGWQYGRLIPITLDLFIVSCVPNYEF
jgi:hypothetical protein